MCDLIILIWMLRIPLLSGFRQLAGKDYAVNADTIIIRIRLHAFHAIVTDLLRIQVAAVTLSAADAFPVIKDALLMYGHLSTSIIFTDYTTPLKGRSSFEQN